MTQTDLPAEPVTERDFDYLLDYVLPDPDGDDYCPGSVSQTHNTDPDPDGCCQWCGNRIPPPVMTELSDTALDEAIAGRFRAERCAGGTA